MLKIIEEYLKKQENKIKTISQLNQNKEFLEFLKSTYQINFDIQNEQKFISFIGNELVDEWANQIYEFQGISCS